MRTLVLIVAGAALGLGALPPAPAQGIEYLGSTLWSGVCDVKIQGNYAYCAFFNGLLILDITNPVVPDYVSQYYTGGEWYNYDRWEGQRVFLSGDYIYFAADYQGLKIINVSDLLNPALSSEYVPDGTVSDVCVQDNYAYLVCDSDIIILDVTDPSSPILIGMGTFDGDGLGIDVVGNYAYIGAYAGFSGFQIMDITDKTNPHVVGHYYIYGTYDVRVLGNTAYLTGGVFTILDISDKTNPVFVGNWVDLVYGCYVVGSYINGNYAYLTSGGRFYVLDISDPSQPALLAQLRGDWYSGLVLCPRNSLTQ